MKLLLIEDHKGLALSLFEYLEPKGFEMDWASNGIQGYELATQNNYDLIILDIAMPGMDGLSVCRKLREEAASIIPVIMLTARDTLDDKVLGLDVGADDYLVKPFELKELHYRILSKLRRNTTYKQGFTLTFEDLSYNTKTKQLFRAGQELHLPKTSLKILSYLMQNSERLVSGVELENHVWNNEPPSSGALRTHLHTLRQVVDKPFKKQIIYTVPGQGYRLKS